MSDEFYDDDEEEYDDEYESECRAPCLGEHRETLDGSDDEYVLRELERAWSYVEIGPKTDWVKQDWATFRAITLREARRRGLKPTKEIFDLLEKRGVEL